MNFARLLDPMQFLRPAALSLLLASVFVVLTSTGCLNLEPQPDPTRFYTLAVDSTPGETTRSGPVDLLVRDVELAQYLDNSKLVERVGPSELHYDPFHRWGGALDAMIGDVVVRTLDEALPTLRVSGAAFARAPRILDLRILRFEYTREGEVVVSLEWILKHTPEDSGETRIETGRLTRTAARHSADAGEIVAQLTSLLQETINALAAELQGSGGA